LINSSLDNNEIAVEDKFYDPSRFFDEYIGQDEIIIDEKAIPQINT